LLQEAIHPVYQQDAQTTGEIEQTIQKLQKLKEHLQEEEDLESQLRVVDI